MGEFADLAPVVSVAADLLLEEARAAIPQRTGQTADRLNVAISGGDTQVTMRLQGDQVAKWLITGTPPHSIDAVNAPVLAFYWERMGRWFFGPHVNHPGTAPNDWRRLVGPALMPQVRAAGHTAAALTLENIRRRVKP